MKIICLDLEGVLVPEIWIEVSKATGIPELQRTTRDEPDYDKLMRFRLDILKKNSLKLPDIQSVIGNMEPLTGAMEFCENIRKKTQLIILSDTFEEFAKPLMKKLKWPTLFCNSLEVAHNGDITGYRLRQQEGKKHAVLAFKKLNMRVFAAGDSFNDIKMLMEADEGCLFRPPENIRKEYSQFPCVDNYKDFMERIDAFLGN